MGWVSRDPARELSQGLHVHLRIHRRHAFAPASLPTLYLAAVGAFHEGAVGLTLRIDNADRGDRPASAAGTVQVAAPSGALATHRTIRKRFPLTRGIGVLPKLIGKAHGAALTDEGPERGRGLDRGRSLEGGLRRRGGRRSKEATSQGREQDPRPSTSRAMGQRTPESLWISLRPESLHGKTGTKRGLIAQACEVPRDQPASRPSSTNRGSLEITRTVTFSKDLVV